MKPFAPRDSNVVHPHGPRGHEGTEQWPAAANDAAHHPAVALRRFRVPVPARVRADRHALTRVTTDRVAVRAARPAPATLFADRGGPSGGVTQCAGPWRTSGGWWTADERVDEPRRHRGVSMAPWPVRAWDRDEWDVTLTGGATYRIFRDRNTGAWFIEGVVD